MPNLDDILIVSGAAVATAGTGLSVATVAGWQAGLGVAAVVLGLLELAAGLAAGRNGARRAR